MWGCTAAWLGGLLGGALWGAGGSGFSGRPGGGVAREGAPRAGALLWSSSLSCLVLVGGLLSLVSGLPVVSSGVPSASPSSSALVFFVHVRLRLSPSCSFPWSSLCCCVHLVSVSLPPAALNPRSPPHADQLRHLADHHHLFHLAPPISLTLVTPRPSLVTTPWCVETPPRGSTPWGPLPHLEKTDRQAPQERGNAASLLEWSSLLAGVTPVVAALARHP